MDDLLDFEKDCCLIKYNDHCQFKYKFFHKLEDALKDFDLKNIPITIIQTVINF